jgi:hypothetical protein
VKGDRIELLVPDREKLYRMAQEMADQLGEPVLVVTTKPDGAEYGGGACLGYAAIKSNAEKDALDHFEKEFVPSATSGR